MAGYRIDNSGWPGRHAAVRTDALAHGPEGGPCLAILSVAKDFQDLIRAECPRCRGGTGDCLVGQLRAAVRDAAPD
jgi:hypothetical protein